MKGLIALVMYCVLFSSAFLLFYTFMAPDRQEQMVGALDGRSGGDAGRGLQFSKSYSYSPQLSPKDALAKVIRPYRRIRQGCPKIPKPLMQYVPDTHSDPLTDREKVLAMCKQTQPITVDDFFTETMRATLTKIGEGAFADVFGCQKEGWDKLAIKVIPIEGNFKYNDEHQNTFKSIQTEIVVSIELSLLGDESRKEDTSVLHYTKNFMQIERVALCAGKFPDFLMDVWDDFDFRKKSDNDRPDVFPEDQLYIMFSAENSGVQLGSYVYHSFEEAISILQQVSATIAIGEAALQFEHRDMHRGNILVRRTHQEYIYFRLDGVEYSIKSYGVMATIVDYTLSRVKQENTECTSYTDLNKMPWLFKGKSDIQFDVYRDMRNHTGGHWEKFYPYTNVLWINYQATKISIKAKLKGLSYRVWKNSFKYYLSQIPNQRSARDIFLNIFSPEAIQRHRGIMAHRNV